MAIATRTRSKATTNSENDKEFEEFIKSIVPSTNNDEISSTSYTTSSSSSTSSSSHYWSPESPDSVVPGSTTTSSDTDTSTVVTSNHVCTDGNASDNFIPEHGSSDGNITSLPGLTKCVDTDLKVSISSVLTWLTTFTHF